MTKPIDTQNLTGDKENSRWPSAGNWLKHITKMLFSFVVAGIIFYYLVWPQIQVNYFYGATQCLILSSKLESLAKQATDIINTGFQPKFLAIYTVDQKIYTVWTYDILNNIFTNPAASLTAKKEFQVNHYYMCWYNKSNPHQVVLKRGWDRISLVFFFMTISVFLVSVIKFRRWRREKNMILVKAIEESP